MNGRHAILLVLAAALHLYSGATAAMDWRPFSNADGNFYDASSITRDNDRINVWTYHNEIDGRNRYSNRSQIQFDCAKKTATTLQFMLYSGFDLRGELIGERVFKPGEVPTGGVPPGSILEVLLDTVCQVASSAQIGGGSRAASLGTGFVVDPTGFVVTSYHVVESAKQISVRCGGGPAEEATLEASSRVNDIAVLRTESKPKSYLTVGRARSATVGTPVFTMGFPVTSVLGEEPKFTDGTISATSGLGGDQSFLQISVPIQPGNSGGPLVNDRGEVVGIIAATAAVEAFFRSSGTLPQNVNWAVKADLLSIMVDLPPPQTLTRSRQEAIARTQGALCAVEAVP